MDDEQVLPCHGKLSFDTEKEAQATAVVARHRYGGQLHPYLCQHCGLWHLSSN